MAGFLCAAETPGVEGETFNLGTGSEVSVGELVTLVGKILGRELSVTRDGERLRPEKSEVLRLLSDNRKAKARLGWQPQVELEQGLSMTVDWIRQNLHLFRPDQYQR